MTYHSIAELANTWRPRYLRASRKEKTRILDEFVALTGYHRSAHEIEYFTGQVRHPGAQKWKETKKVGQAERDAELFRSSVSSGSAPGIHARRKGRPSSGVGGLWGAPLNVWPPFSQRGWKC
jgi:hypothetical protein